MSTTFITTSSIAGSSGALATDPETTTYNQVFGTAGDDRNDDFVRGTAGNDMIYDYAGRDELYGGAGNDIFVLARDGDKDEIKDFTIDEDRIDISAWGVANFSQLLITQDGAHTRVQFGDEILEVKFTQMSDLLAGDFIFATEVFGTTGDDRDEQQVRGTEGNDLIYDNAGRDDVSGSEGQDVFVMAHDGEEDRIKDFTFSDDRIDISAWGAGSFSQLNVTQDDADTRVQFGDEVLVLKGINASELLAGDFIFANEVFGTTSDDRNDQSVSGTSGNDVIFDYAGSDEMFGGAGYDLFVMALDGDKDMISDFTIDQDRIDVSAWGVTDFSQLDFVQDGAHVRLSSGNEVLEVRHTGVSDLVPGDFVFANEVFGTSGADRSDQRISGTSGNDVIHDLAGNDEMFGGAGYDLFVMALDGDRDEISDFTIDQDRIDVSAWGVADISQLDFVQDGAHVRLSSGTEVLEVRYTGVSELVPGDFVFSSEVFGTSGDDRNDQTIHGTDGNELIYDLAGSDEMFGGAGFDVFVMASDGDNDVISDFTIDQDRIDVSAWGVTDIHQLDFEQDFAHVRITSGAEVLEVRHTGVSELVPGDFVFADVPAEPVYNDVFGTSGDDRNDTRLLGTAGDDRIFDLEGRDEIIGRGGNDIFVMALDGDRDEIKDFTAGEDIIDISSWSVSDFSMLNIFQDGAHTRVRFDAEDIEVKGFAAADFLVDDFIL